MLAWSRSIRAACKGHGWVGVTNGDGAEVKTMPLGASGAADQQPNDGRPVTRLSLAAATTAWPRLIPPSLHGTRE